MRDNRLVKIIASLRKSAADSDDCPGCGKRWEAISEILMKELHPVEAMLFDRKLSHIVGEGMRSYLLDHTPPFLCEQMPPQFVLGAVIQATAECIEAVAPLGLDGHLSRHAQRSKFQWPNHWQREPDKL